MSGSQGGKRRPPGDETARELEAARARIAELEDTVAEL